MEPPRADAVAGLVVSVAFWQGGEFAATGLFAGRDQQRTLIRNQISGIGLKTLWSRWINIEYSSVAFHRPESTWNHSKSRRHHDVVTPHSQ